MGDLSRKMPSPRSKLVDSFGKMSHEINLQTKKPFAPRRIRAALMGRKAGSQALEGAKKADCPKRGEPSWLPYPRAR